MVERKNYSGAFVIFFNRLMSLFLFVGILIISIALIIDKNSIRCDEESSYFIFFAFSILFTLYAYFWMIKVKYLVYENESFFIGFFIKKRISNFHFIFYLAGHVSFVFFFYTINNKKHWACTVLRFFDYKDLLEELKAVNKKIIDSVKNEIDSFKTALDYLSLKTCQWAYATIKEAIHLESN